MGPLQKKYVCQIGKKVRPGSLGTTKNIGEREYRKSPSDKKHKKKCSGPVSADPICPFPSSGRRMTSRPSWTESMLQKANFSGWQSVRKDAHDLRGPGASCERAGAAVPLGFRDGGASLLVTPRRCCVFCAVTRAHGLVTAYGESMQSFASRRARKTMPSADANHEALSHSQAT